MSDALWTDRPPGSFLDDVYNYLTLLFDHDDALRIADDLSTTVIVQRRANDILRAADLLPSAMDDPSVMASMERLAQADRLPPTFLVVRKHRLIIADGYHRTSAVYWSNDFSMVDCLISYE